MENEEKSVTSTGEEQKTETLKETSVSPLQEDAKTEATKTPSLETTTIKIDKEDKKSDEGDGKDVEKPDNGEDSSGPPAAKRPKASDDEPKGVKEGDDGAVGSGTEKLPLRRFKRIPIFIVDYHNDVLEFIYRCLGSRHLPLEGNTLIHFDSHPDLVISRELPAKAMLDKETMLAELSIENWIMPLCYTGQFKRIVWLKNSWCQQIPVGRYDFKIGHKQDKVSVDSPLDYFISEGNYVETSELENARDMELWVYNTDTPDPAHGVDPKEFLNDEQSANNYILDIDLDFFSATNPFLEIYKDAQCYEQLTEIFRFDNEEAPQSQSQTPSSKNTERRKLQLEALKRIFEHLEESRTLDDLPNVNVPGVIPQATYDRISQLVQSLKNLYADDEIDWLLIYDSGSTTDANGLPHHVSTTKELEQYFESFKRFLQRLPAPPLAITIACSAEDDYCPKAQVAFIQEKVLSILKETFGEKLHEKPILHYLDEEFDVHEL